MLGVAWLHWACGRLPVACTGGSRCCCTRTIAIATSSHSPHMSKAAHPASCHYLLPHLLQGTAELAAAIAGAQRLRDKLKQEAASSAGTAAAAAVPAGLQPGMRSASAKSDVSSAGPHTPGGTSAQLQPSEAGSLLEQVCASSPAAADGLPLPLPLPSGGARAQQPEGSP